MDGTIVGDWDTFARWKRAADPSAFVPCHAPFTALSFQVDGRVFACCRKPAPVLGSILESSLDAIWNGAVAQALRAALRARTFPAACGACAHLALGGRPEIADIRKYEHLVPVPGQVERPRRMEFNLANTCNLECIHCTGKLSSSIRARRENLPPVPRVYGDAFFAELDGWLPHLVEAVFLGGEPFLQLECHRIWNTLIDSGARTRCVIITNGTILDARVERVLATLPFLLTVSLDGARRETIEATRVHARYDVLVEHLGRFAELARRPGCQLRLAICPMRTNWQEFGDFCRWADALGAQVQVNPLTDPAHLSLFRLDATELAPIVAGLQQQAATIGPSLGRNRAVLEGFARTLTTHLEHGAGVAFGSALVRARRATLSDADGERRA